MGVSARIVVTLLFISAAAAGPTGDFRKAVFSYGKWYSKFKE